MPVTGYTTYRLFGGPGDLAGRHAASPPTQTQGELISATEGRRFRGPKVNGHFCLHGKATAAFGAGSTATVWYSNMPDPDPNDDTMWVQDASIAAVDLTSTNGFLINAGNVFAEWIRLKITRAVSDGSAWAYIRVEGDQVR